LVRTETITVGAVRAAPQLRNVFGFTMNPAADGDTIASAVGAVAAVRAEVRYANGRVASLWLRAGQIFNARASRMDEVWFTAASPGALGLDVAYDPDDELVPTPAQGRQIVPPGTLLRTDVFQWLEAVASFNPGQLAQTGPPPAGAASCILISEAGASASPPGFHWQEGGRVMTSPYEPAASGGFMDPMTGGVVVIPAGSSVGLRRTGLIGAWGREAAVAAQNVQGITGATYIRCPYIPEAGIRGVVYGNGGFGVVNGLALRLRYEWRA
jgi:hypothetical protein